MPCILPRGGPTPIGRVEAALNEQDAPGLNAALNSFYDSLHDLASSTAPGAPVEREGLRAAAGGVIDTLGSLDAELRSQRTDANSGIASVVTEINQLSSRIAELNAAISPAVVSVSSNIRCSSKSIPASRMSSHGRSDQVE